MTLHIDSADAVAINAADLAFASGDNILLDISTTGDLDGCLTDSAGTESTGSYLSGTLTLEDAISDATGLSLSQLGDLGIDQIDLNGSDSSVTLHIDSADAVAMSDAGLAFAGGDFIKMDVTDDSDEAAGNYLSTSMLDELDNLGVDLIVSNYEETFIELGSSISSSDDLADLLASLSSDMDDISFVIDEDGNDANTSLIVENDQFGDSTSVEQVVIDNRDGLMRLGIDHVYYASDSGEDLISIGLEGTYQKLDVNVG